jgi:hypothetical protein
MLRGIIDHQGETLTQFTFAATGVTTQFISEACDQYPKSVPDTNADKYAKAWDHLYQQFKEKTQVLTVVDPVSSSEHVQLITRDRTPYDLPTRHGVMRPEFTVDTK